MSKTLDYFKSYIAKIPGIGSSVVFTDEELQVILAQSSIFISNDYQVRQNNREGTLFGTTQPLLMDDEVFVFKVTDTSVIPNLSESLESEYWNKEDPLWVQTKVIAIDYSTGQIRFLTAVDTITYKIIAQYSYVNLNSAVASVLTQLGTINNTKSETRGKISYSFNSYIDMAKQLTANDDTGSDTGFITVSNLKRESLGRIQGTT